MPVREADREPVIVTFPAGTGLTSADRGAQLRLVIPPGSPVPRLAQLMDTVGQPHIYPSPGAAAAREPRPRHPRPSQEGLRWPTSSR